MEITAATMAKLGARDPRDDRTVCGPVISARQRDRIEGYLELARAEGGAFATGAGGRRAGTRASGSSRPSSPGWTTPPAPRGRRSSARCW
nr:hypothetical protein GCM10020093_108330 [Planobispora longispora]